MLWRFLSLDSLSTPNGCLGVLMGAIVAILLELISSLVCGTADYPAVNPYELVTAFCTAVSIRTNTKYAKLNVWSKS